MANEPAIVVEGLLTVFGPKIIHEDLSFEVRRGEVLAIVGGSGTGKSVLLRHIIGLTTPNAGEIRILGERLTELSPKGRNSLRGRLGMLFQDGALFSSLTVTQNIQIPLMERMRIPRELLDEIAGLKLALVGLPADAGPKFPSELSGGMRKRAGLARALAFDPEILFLDEPTAGLDPVGAAEFDQLILSLQRSLGLTVVMITHDLDSLVTIADRIAALVDRKAMVGTMDELRGNPHPWLREYFGGPRGRAASDARERSSTPSAEQTRGD